MLEESTNAERPLRVYEGSNDLEAVDRHLVEESRAGVGRRASTAAGANREWGERPGRIPDPRSDKEKRIMKIGLLCGREHSFPPAFIERVNELGKSEDITAELAVLGGTAMDETARYRVIVDRISHEVTYYRGYLKQAVLQGTHVINNPFWWSADDKFFNYAVAQKLGIAVPKTVLLPQKSYPQDVDITSESLRNLQYPLEWDALLDFVGRPAILKPFTGGGKHVYKVNNCEELLAAYDATGPYCMMLQEFIDFQQYVQCFTFGKTDVMPVAYDPHERRYLVEHEYLTPELGARVVRDTQTLNLALGYEMNAVEFAIKDGVPFAIDFMNPVPDFERDHITEFYFEQVVDNMALLVIDRALSGSPVDSWPRWEEMLGLGGATGFVGTPRTKAAGAGA
jgi:glutathione synthase/RimK-type ligase-like ATP-grasp enzyme